MLVDIGFMRDVWSVNLREGFFVTDKMYFGEPIDGVQFLPFKAGGNRIIAPLNLVSKSMFFRGEERADTQKLFVSQ